MAVTKRTRFEVLKRDDHTCQYCGERAPNITLHVDHVIPVALGGTDNPDNLVAACKDCNTGKGSTSPDAAKVAEVNTQALAYSQALRTNLAAITATYRGIRKAKKGLDQAWDRIAYDCGWGVPPKKDNNWGSTLHKWLKLGLTADYIEYAMEVALGKDHIYSKDVFRYFCGVIYRTLDDAHERTQVETRGEQRCDHCDNCRLNSPDEYHECTVYGEHDEGEDPVICRACGVQDCFYEHGYLRGEEDGSIKTYMEFYHVFDHYNNCVEVNHG